jgi:hypothetical protein
MPRKISSGISGGNIVGGLLVQNNTFTAAENDNINIDPVGAGALTVAGPTVVTGNLTLQAQSDLRFADADSSNWVAFQAPSTVASNVTWTLPSIDASVNGHALLSNSSGTLSWGAAGTALTDNISDAGTNYVLFSSAASGLLNSVRVSSSKLTFQPSTGTLTCSALTVNGVVTSLKTENEQATNYTLALADQDRIVAINSASNLTVTIPTNSVPFPVGSVVGIYRAGAGTVTLAAPGVTITKTGNFGAFEQILVRKRDTNAWVVIDEPRSLTASGGSPSTSGGFSIRSFTSTGASTLTIG